MIHLFSCQYFKDSIARSGKSKETNIYFICLVFVPPPLGPGSVFKTRRLFIYGVFEFFGYKLEKTKEINIFVKSSTPPPEPGEFQKLDVYGVFGSLRFRLQLAHIGETQWK